MNIFDPTMTVPPEVVQAADKVAAYFEERGFTEWRLCGVASRSQLEQAEADRAAFEAAGESARERLAVRVEELQQAVQARLAAQAARDQLAQRVAELQEQHSDDVARYEQMQDLALSATSQRDQLLAELTEALDSLEYIELHLPALVGWKTRQERIASARAAIAAVKGGAA